MSGSAEEQALNNEIARLEAQLKVVRASREHATPQPATTTTTGVASTSPNNDNGTLMFQPIITQSRTANTHRAALHSPSTPHALLLLSDSALPLGSFAFSSGLESYLLHHKPLPPTTTPLASFHRFLGLSIASVAGTALPYIIAAYRNPAEIVSLDNDLDASTPCTVARRASVAQGRALLSVWERAFRSVEPSSSPPSDDAAAAALSTFSALLKHSTATANGHFAPLWSLVSLSHSLSLPQTAYIFLFSHARAVLSAAVRASVMGPYQAQGVLASAWLQREIEKGVSGNWEVRMEEAGQRVPLVDLWVGRHEMLYSRIFNS